MATFRDLPLCEGPVISEGEEVCWNREKRCKHFLYHDGHYAYCAAQDAPNKHAAPDELAYPWHGAGKHIFRAVPNDGCPFKKPA